MRSAIASRTGINIYFLEYFMAVRNCINIFVLYGLAVLHGHKTYIRTIYVYLRNFFFINGISVDLFVCLSAKYVTAGNLNARMNPSSY